MNSVDGENRKTFIKGDIVNLFFEYEIFLDRENFVFCIEIFNTKGVQIVACSAGDMMDESQFESLKTKGKHSVTVELDTSIFATGDYLIKFDVAIHNIKRIITDTPTMQFSIINSDENIGQSATSRQGIILPNWKWKV